MKTNVLWVLMVASAALYVYSAMSWHRHGFGWEVATGEAVGMTGLLVGAAWLVVRFVRSRRLPRR